MLQKGCLVILTAMGAVKNETLLFSDMSEIQIKSLKAM